ncbi:MAG: protein-glutamate O-methyltransferase CheR [Planctomycetota bacterium]
MEPLQPNQVLLLQDLIYAKCGIRLDDRKVTLLTSRVKRRLRATGIDDSDQYLQLVTSRKGKIELTKLLDAITTNETSFFRTESHFSWFKESFLPEMIQARADQRRNATLRLWSAACANGAEPYSLSFCLHEVRHRLAGWDVEILATDLSEASIEAARAGDYRGRIVESLTDANRKKYFDKKGNAESTFTVKSQFRSMIEFRIHNLMDRLSHRLVPFDCIFLRNVLIYFDDLSKRKVLANLLPSLAEGGYLIVGPSEGVYGMHQPLLKRSTFLYQKEQTDVE